jgi:glycosyltransferase involved in cell wall biosynthesis
MKRVVMWSTDPVGKRMAGPGIRYHRLAIELSKRFDVTLVGPGSQGVDNAPYAYRPVAEVRSAIDLPADVVVAQVLPLPLARALYRRGTRLIYDLYVPSFIEGAAHLAEQGESSEIARRRYAELRVMQRFALELGDAFICASERQRDLWLGSLALLGRIDPARYALDPSLRTLIDVVPCGLDLGADQVGAPALRGVVEGISASDHVLLWGGGVWNWLDPLTVIEAVGLLSRDLPDLRLFFLGLTHPSHEVDEMSMAGRAIALAQQLGIEGSHVFFNREWVPYDRRLDYFREADLGVSAHLDTAEGHFAFRTRMLDHFAVGTPVVATSGDVLSELVAERGLGRVVAPGEVDGWVSALRGLLEHPAELREARSNVLAAREEFAWERVAEPLERLVDTSSERSAGRRTGVLVVRTSATLLGSLLARRGVRATLRTLAARRHPGRAAKLD